MQSIVTRMDATNTIETSCCTLFASLELELDLDLDLHPYRTEPSSSGTIDGVDAAAAAAAAGSAFLEFLGKSITNVPAAVPSFLSRVAIAGQGFFSPLDAKQRPTKILAACLREPPFFLSSFCYWAIVERRHAHRAEPTRRIYTVWFSSMSEEMGMLYFRIMEDGKKM